jgi:hypothetical protein
MNTSLAILTKMRRKMMQNNNIKISKGEITTSTKEIKGFLGTILETYIKIHCII